MASVSQGLCLLSPLHFPTCVFPAGQTPDPLAPRLLVLQLFLLSPDVRSSAYRPCDSRQTGWRQRLFDGARRAGPLFPAVDTGGGRTEPRQVWGGCLWSWAWRAGLGQGPWGRAAVATCSHWRFLWQAAVVVWSSRQKRSLRTSRRRSSSFWWSPPGRPRAEPPRGPREGLGVRAGFMPREWQGCEQGTLGRQEWWGSRPASSLAGESGPSPAPTAGRASA